MGVDNQFFVAKEDFCLHQNSLGEGMMMAEKNAMLRRQSMELLKEPTEILQRIIGSGDEQSLSRLRETIRTLYESRREAASRPLSRSFDEALARKTGQP
jgi:hypothetical protein